MGLVADDVAQSVQSADVAFAVEPESDVTAFGVLVVQMFEAALVEGGEVGLGIELGTIRHRAVYDGERVDQPVRLRNDSAIDSARRMVAAGAMVLDSVAHGEQLTRGEPLPEHRVRHQYLAGVYVVPFAVDTQSEVVVGGNRVRHLLVYNDVTPLHVISGAPIIILLSELEALADDGQGMVAVVSAVKGIVLR